MKTPTYLSPRLNIPVTCWEVETLFQESDLFRRLCPTHNLLDLISKLKRSPFRKITKFVEKKCYFSSNICIIYDDEYIKNKSDDFFDIMACNDQTVDQAVVISQTYSEDDFTYLNYVLLSCSPDQFWELAQTYINK